MTPPESGSDVRMQFYWDVLQLALEETRPKWGPFQMQPAPKVMTPARAEMQLSNSQDISVMARTTSQERERKLLPIRLPLDKGLTGYRLFLIKEVNQPAYSGIRSTNELRQFTIGQAASWIDVDILRNAGLEVVGDVRNQLGNQLVRIVLRTGQPGQAPERNVIVQYDINDYKEKTALDADKLYTTTYTALKQYKALLGTEQVTLDFTDDAIAEIARIAAQVNASVENIGARRLSTVMEKLLEEVSFTAEDMAGTALEIDAAYVDKQLADVVGDTDLSKYVL